MRNAFIHELCIAAKHNKNIYFICADVGYSVIEPFATAFPERFINVGIAEQNMIGVAAGLAISGKKVFVYSITNFAVTRCLEQIRNDICIHNADVTVVSVGAGFAYGPQGYSHHGLEDISFMRCLSGMTVAVPADAVELTLLIKTMLVQNGPKYLRLARGGEPALHQFPPANWQFGKPIMVRKGERAIILAIGPIAQEALKAIEGLKEIGLYTLPIVTPLDTKSIEQLAMSCQVLVTVEEHSICGGLGSIVSEIVAGLSQPHATLTLAGVNPQAEFIIGNRMHCLRAHGIDAEGICQLIVGKLNE